MAHAARIAIICVLVNVNWNLKLTARHRTYCKLSNHSTTGTALLDNRKDGSQPWEGMS